MVSFRYPGIETEDNRVGLAGAMDTTEGSNTSLKSYKFPRDMDLGTSYGSYLRSPGTRHKPSSVPSLPKIKIAINKDGGSAPTMTGLYNNLHVLVESLNAMFTQAKARGCSIHSLQTTYISLSTAMYDLGPVLQHLDRSYDSHMTQETLRVMMIYVLMVIQALVESVDAIMTSKSSDTRDRLYKQTKAELCAVRNGNNKLSQKLRDMEETNTALQQELESTRQLLKVATKDIETEKLKSQSVKLVAQSNKRELVDMKRQQSNAVQKSLEKQITSLQHKLEQRHKVEKQLRRQIHEDGVRIKQLQSQTNAKRKKEIEQAYTSRRQPLPDHKTHALPRLNVHHHDNRPRPEHEAEGLIKKPHPTKYSMVDIASLAEFKDSVIAKETMNLLDKQGFL